MFNDLFDEIKLLIFEKYLSDRFQLLKLVDRTTKNLIESFIKHQNKIDKSIWLESNELTNFALINHIPINYKVFKPSLKRGLRIDVQRFDISPKSLYYFVKHQRVEEVKIILNNWRWSIDKVAEQVIFLTLHICFECPNDEIFSLWNEFLSNYQVLSKTELSEKIEFIFSENQYYRGLKPKFYPKLVRRFIDKFPLIGYSTLFTMTDDFCYNDMIVYSIPFRFYLYLFTNKLTFHREPIINEIISLRSYDKLYSYLEKLSSEMSPTEFDYFIQFFSKSVFLLCFETDWFEPFERNLIPLNHFYHIILPIEKSNLFKWAKLCDQNYVDPWNLFRNSILAQKNTDLFDDLKRDEQFNQQIMSSSRNINKFHSGVFFHLYKGVSDIDFDSDMGFPLAEPYKERKLQIYYFLRQLSGSRSMDMLWHIFAIELMNGRLYKDTEEDDDHVIDEFCLQFQTLGMNAKLDHPNYLSIKKYPILLRWVHIFVFIEQSHLSRILYNAKLYDQHMIDFIIKNKIVVDGGHLMKIDKFSLFHRLFTEKLICLNTSSIEIIETLCIKFDHIDFFSKNFRPFQPFQQ